MTREGGGEQSGGSPERYYHRGDCVAVRVGSTMWVRFAGIYSVSRKAHLANLAWANGVLLSCETGEAYAQKGSEVVTIPVFGSESRAWTRLPGGDPLVILAFPDGPEEER